MRGFCHITKVYRNLSSGWIKTAGKIFLVSIVMLQIAAAFWKELAAWYVMHMYPFFLWLFGSISGSFPFPVAEAIACLSVVFFIIYMIRFFGKKMGEKARNLFLGLLCILTILSVINRGINACAPSFAERESVKPGRYYEADLKEFCEFLIGQINENTTDLSGGKHITWEEAGRQAMVNLGTQFPSLKGFYPDPKEMVYSPLLSSVRLGGIYVPFTVEVIYNGEMTAFNIPFTICHELAHAKGFIREDDADFIAYLACVSSEDQELRYSGYLSAWLYAGNNLAEADPEEYRRLSRLLSQQAKEDLKASNEFWRQEAGTMLALDQRVEELKHGGNSKSWTGNMEYERYELIRSMIEEFRGGFRKREDIIISQTTELSRNGKPVR